MDRDEWCKAGEVRDVVRQQSAQAMHAHGGRDVRTWFGNTRMVTQILALTFFLEPTNHTNHTNEGLIRVIIDVYML